MADASERNEHRIDTPINQASDNDPSPPKSVTASAQWSVEHSEPNELPLIGEATSTLPWATNDRQKEPSFSSSLNTKAPQTPELKIIKDDPTAEDLNPGQNNYVIYRPTNMEYIVNEFANVPNMSDEQLFQYIKFVEKNEFEVDKIKNEIYLANSIRGRDSSYLAERQSFIRGLANNANSKELGGEIATDVRTPEEREAQAYVFAYKLSPQFARQYLLLIRDAHLSNMIDAASTPFAPVGVSIEHNINQALDFKNKNPGIIGQIAIYNWFRDQVRGGAVWDFKQKYKLELPIKGIAHPALIEARENYQNYGNYHYGVIGAALGIPDEILVRFAGGAQMLAGTSMPGSGTPLGGPPYGDTEEDQKYIRRGIEDYKAGIFSKK